MRETLKRIEDAGVNTFGTIDAENFNWPVTREDGLQVLRHFCKHLLVHFGDYQDAMDPEQTYLFHSRLSFAMNTAGSLAPTDCRTRNWLWNGYRKISQASVATPKM